MRAARSQYYSQFDPRALGGCLLWIDANDSNSFTLSGSNVTALSDKSGSGSAVTALTGTVAWTSNGLNSRPTFDLTSGNFRGSFSSTTIASNYTHSTFVVTRLNTATGNGNPFLVLMQPETSFSVFYRSLDYSTSGPSFRTVAFFASVGGISIAAQTTSPFLWTEYYEGDQTNNSIVSLSNGANQAAALAGAAPTTSPGFFTVGTEWSPADSWNRYTWPGTVSEIILYNNILTGEQRQLVEGYLAWKWGLETTNLPATHPYRYSYPFIRPFAPPDAGQCEYWFDAADRETITASDTTLTTWSNKGTNLGSNLTTAAGTLTTGSVAQQNGLNLVGMNGGAYGQITAAFPTQQRTRFFACRPTVNQASTTVLFLNQTGTLTGRDTIVLDAGDGGRPTELAQSVALRMVTSNTLANQSNVFGVYTFRNASTTARNRIAYTGSNMTLKTNTTATSYRTSSLVSHLGSNLDLGDWISYNSQLGLVQTLQVEGYLAWKWGVQTSLPSDHLFRSRPPVSPAFVPTQISGCMLWLDAGDPSTITLSESNVTQWNDKSGNGRNATKSAAGTLTLSNDRIVFNGTAYLTLPSGTFPIGNSNYSFLTVGSTDRSSYQNIFFTGIYEIRRSIDAIYYPDGALESGWFTANIVSPAGTISANQTTLVENVYSSPTLTAYVNGTSVASSSSLGTRNNPSGITVIGGNLEGNQALKGTMCEFLVYSSGLTITQRQKIEGYLAWKWGLQTSLPIGHPYRSIKP